MKCDRSEGWTNLPDVGDGEDFCKCTVQCSSDGSSSFCLGIGDHKTSIKSEEVEVEWESSSLLKLDWKDSCSNTRASSYQVSVYRRYLGVGPDLKQVSPWTKVSRGRNSDIEDFYVQKDLPERFTFHPGLRIQYRFQQEIDYDDLLTPTVAEDEQTTVDVQVPFFFSFSALLTSPDAVVDVVGAKVLVKDVLTDDILYSYVTKERSTLAGGRKEEPEVVSVQLHEVRKQEDVYIS